MSDNGRSVFFVFLQEVVGTGEGYLVDILVNFLGGHTDTVVAHGQCFCLGVNAYAHLEFAQLALEVALHGQGLELLCGINGVADYLAEKNLVVAVKKLLDDRENVLCGNSDISFLHFYVVLMVIFCSVSDKCKSRATLLLPHSKICKSPRTIFHRRNAILHRFVRLY